MELSNGPLYIIPGSHIPSGSNCKEVRVAGVVSGQQDQEALQQEPSKGQDMQQGHSTSNTQVHHTMPSGPIPNGAVPLLVPAGSVVVMTDTVVHSSTTNRSRHMRRSWMPQFSSKPITWRSSEQLVAMAVPMAEV